MSNSVDASASIRFRTAISLGGRLAYCTLAAARSASLVLHELGHTLGLYHSASQSDVMYCSAGRPTTFSARERLVLRLARARQSGNRWPDNDRQLGLAVQASDTETIGCGGPVDTRDENPTGRTLNREGGS